jgi:hypothetical protein
VKPKLAYGGMPNLGFIINFWTLAIIATLKKNYKVSETAFVSVVWLKDRGVHTYMGPIERASFLSTEELVSVNYQIPWCVISMRSA